MSLNYIIFGSQNQGAQLWLTETANGLIVIPENSNPAPLPLMKALPRICLVSGIASGIMSCGSYLAIAIAFAVFKLGTGSSLDMLTFERTTEKASAIGRQSFTAAIVFMVLMCLALWGSKKS